MLKPTSCISLDNKPGTRSHCFYLFVDYHPHQQTYNREDKSHFDLADQLQDLHATILEKLENLDEMRARLREEFVPSSVCQNLEQCLKDSEVRPDGAPKLLQPNMIA